jgi:hypothetical protein
MSRHVVHNSIDSLRTTDRCPDSCHQAEKVQGAHLLLLPLLNYRRFVSEKKQKISACVPSRSIDNHSSRTLKPLAAKRCVSEQLIKILSADQLIQSPIRKMNKVHTGHKIDLVRYFSAIVKHSRRSSINVDVMLTSNSSYRRNNL